MAPYFYLKLKIRIMKHTLLFIFFGILFQVVAAQPVLNYTDIAFTAQTNITVDSVDYVDLSGQLGVNQTWDLSDLSSVGSAFSYNVVETASTLYAPAFPNSNYAYEVMDIYFCWLGSSESIENHGFGMMIQGYSMLQVYSDPKTQITFPLTYQSSGSDNFESTTDMAGFFTSDESGTRNWSVDGYGTLILPSGTYSDVLLVHAEETSTSEQDVFGTVLEMETTVEEYIFYAADYQFPLGIFSTITTDDGFQQETTQDGAILSSQSVSVAETAIRDLKLAPNPANNELRISVPMYMGQGVIEVINLSGQVVYSERLSGGVSSNHQLSVGDLPRGMYMVQLRTEKEIFRSRVVLD